MKRGKKGHKLLLGSVVKISLQATALVVGGLDQARPRLLHLVELRSQLNLKVGVLAGQLHRDSPPVSTTPEPFGVDAKLG